jgi:hypothetical protein
MLLRHAAHNSVQNRCHRCGRQRSRCTRRDSYKHSGHRKGNSLCDINRNARTRTFEWQESSGAGGPCTHIEAIGKVARQGTHSGRSRQRQARSLSASGCCYTLQSRHEGKIRTSDIDWEMQEAGDHSRYAKADCHRKCPSTGSAKMGRISSLTNTDTQRLLCKRLPGNGQRHSVL